MRTWVRYLLFQIPGWVITAIILSSLWHAGLLSFTLALLGFLAWFVKDLLLYPYLKRAYEPTADTGSAALVGALGIAQDDLNPSGHIRIHGELWRADAVPADQVIVSGARVEVIHADGMRLFVRAASERDATAGGKRP